MARLVAVSLLALLGAAVASAPARANASGGDRVVVRFSGSASASERAGARRQAGARALHSVPALAGVQVVRVPEGQALRAADLLQRSEEVVWAGEDQRVRIGTALPAGDGSRSGGQWGLLNTGQWVLGHSECPASTATSRARGT